MWSSLPCFRTFCRSAIPTSCYILNVFYCWNLSSGQLRTGTSTFVASFYHYLNCSITESECSCCPKNHSNLSPHLLTAWWRHHRTYPPTNWRSMASGVRHIARDKYNFPGNLQTKSDRTNSINTRQVSPSNVSPWEILIATFFHLLLAKAPLPQQWIFAISTLLEWVQTVPTVELKRPRTQTSWRWQVPLRLLAH